MAMNIVERTQWALREPEFLNDLCIHLAEGGTLRTFCSNGKLQYLTVYQWVTLDEERNGIYQNALKARRQMLEDIVIDKLSSVVGADVRKGFNKLTGDPLPAHELPDEVAMALGGYEHTENDKGVVTRKMKMLDALRAAELMGKTSSMFREAVEVHGTETLADILRAAKKPMEESV